MFWKSFPKFCKCGAELESLKITVQKLIERIDKMDNAIQAKIDKLTADVAAETKVEQSAVVLIGGLSQQLKDALAAAKTAGASDDQLASFDALDASLSGSTADLAAAVAANTPAS